MSIEIQHQSNVITPTVMVMAGGTGGHIFPALAVARELQGRGIGIEWLGTQEGMEAEVVRNAGIRMHWVKITGLRGKGALQLLSSPLKLASALVRCLQIFRQVRPVVVLGMGGYVSGPGGLAAWLGRRPLIIHEQNAVAGTTNRLLARVSKRVLCGFPAALANSSWVGNPVRREIAELAAPADRYVGRKGPVRLLVIGGSLGAQALNELVPKALKLLESELAFAVRHQTGKRTLEVAQHAYSAVSIDAEVLPFIDDMAAAYGWADVVISRSGALSCAEIAAAGLPAILVPFPHAVDDHQTANANQLVDAGAAVVLQQSAMTAEVLAAALADLPLDRTALQQRAVAARCVAKADATGVIADIICEQVGWPVKPGSGVAA